MLTGSRVGPGVKVAGGSRVCPGDPVSPAVRVGDGCVRGLEVKVGCGDSPGKEIAVGLGAARKIGWQAVRSMVMKNAYRRNIMRVILLLFPPSVLRADISRCLAPFTRHIMAGKVISKIHASGPLKKGYNPNLRAMAMYRPDRIFTTTTTTTPPPA